MRVGVPASVGVGDRDAGGRLSGALDNVTYTRDPIFNIDVPTSCPDVPVEVRYSDYRQVNGVSVPFHVQRYLNNGLVLDFVASQATINSGLSDAVFSVQ